MTPQELKAMKQALEALKLLTGAWQTFGALDYGDNAIAALEEALAQQSGWRKVQIDNAEEEAWRELEKKNKTAFKSWLAWYSSPPENWNEKYGNAFVWTKQEKALMQQLKGNT